MRRAQMLKNPIKVSALDAIAFNINKNSYLYEVERTKDGRYFIETYDDEATYRMEIVLKKVEVIKK
jgi:hypothetical protein